MLSLLRTPRHLTLTLSKSKSPIISASPITFPLNNIRISIAKANKNFSTVSLNQKAALRAARRDKAEKTLLEESGAGGKGKGGESGSGAGNIVMPVIGVTSLLLAWGLLSSDSPPYTLFKSLGGVDLWNRTVAETFNRPIRDKLLPDWPMPNVPQDLACPHTLVLDLENTLVSATWSNKFGWRYAKRPGVDKFLTDMSMYYEIVLFSPSQSGVADPIVSLLDKNGCIMHRLFRESTRYIDGVHVKDLSMLNRNMDRIIIIDDDPDSVKLQPDNLIRIKPYLDGRDKEDRALERLTPLLIEIAKENYRDVPKILRQFKGMDADEMALEYRNRLDAMRATRIQQGSRGLGSFQQRAPLPPPAPADPSTLSSNSASSSSSDSKIISSKELVGAAPTTDAATAERGGFMSWYNQRAVNKEEEKMARHEKWQEAMTKRAADKEKEKDTREREARRNR